MYVVEANARTKLSREADTYIELYDIQYTYVVQVGMSASSIHILKKEANNNSI